MAEPKLATCCYCGARTALRPTAREGHALACGQCGAPLSRMKALRPESARAAAAHAPVRQPKPVKRKKHKKRKSLIEKALSEIWDEIEDIFD